MLLFLLRDLSSVPLYVELAVISSVFVGLRFDVWAVVFTIHVPATIEPHDCLTTISTKARGGGLSYQERFSEVAAHFRDDISPSLAC